MVIALVTLAPSFQGNTLAEDAEPAFTPGRGVNLNRPFLDTHKGSVNGHPDMAYNDAPEAFKKNLLDTSLRYGFETVRVNAGVVPLLEGQPDDTARQFKIIDTFVSEALGSGLKVILSLHTLESTNIWTASKILDDADGHTQQAYLDMLASVAQQEAGRDPAKFALALFNEPPVCDGPAVDKWAALQEKLYAVARKNAPKLTLILTGPCFSAIKGIMKIDPAKFDRNTIFDVHFYEPTVFTQQGNSGGLHYTNYIHRLGFPPDKSQSRELFSRFDQEVVVDNVPGDTKTKFESWLQHDTQEFYDKGTGLVTERFDSLYRWMRSRNVSPRRLMVGEFGVRRDYQGHIAATESDRARWVSLVRSRFESRGSGWVFYALVGPWGLTSEDLTEQPSPEMLAALASKSGH